MARMVWILLLVAQAAFAETICPGTSIQVSDRERASEAQTCEAVLRSSKGLKPCGLDITKPVTLELSRGPIRDDPDCLGVLHCGEDRIEILYPQLLSARLHENLSLADIAEQTLFDFILLHELVHAAIRQMDGNTRVSRVEDEYIAYAVSFDALPDHTRDSLLSARGYDRPIRKMELTEDSLWIDPTGFGILAWLHFSTPGNGCAFVARLLDGSSDLFDRAMFDHP